MKKFWIAVLFFLLTAVAYAAPKWMPTTYSGDQLIKTGSAIIVDANIYWAGVTVGDKLELKNGLTSAATTFFTFIAPTANGNYVVPKFQKNLIVDTGIYLEQTISGGAMGVELIYQ